MTRRAIDAAVVGRRGGAPTIERLFMEPPRAGEVVVRIEACGICHTDMVLRDGSLSLAFPAVLGHEGAGTVEEIGSDVSGLGIGDRVVISFMSCRECRHCEAGQPAYCEHIATLNFSGRRSDGSSKLCDDEGRPVSGSVFGQSSFATFALAHVENVVRVDTDLPFHLLAPLGCGVQTGVGTVLETLKVAPGSRLAVLGAGGVGLSAVMAARFSGASTIAVLDRHEGRLRLAAELGATYTMTDLANLPDRLDYVIDTTGAVPLAAAAAERLGIRGTLALIGAHRKGDMIPLEAAFLVKAGRRVIGVIEGGVDPQTFVPRLARMVRDGTLPIGKFIKTYDLSDAAQAIADSEAGTVVKPVLVMTK
jgi:aryl-alcohol dehydrogenase